MRDIGDIYTLLELVMGESDKISRVKPPKESRRSLVSLESLVGIWELFSANALIHFPREVRERLINFASSSK